MTPQTEIEKLIAAGWIMTDPSCNQMRLDLDGEDGTQFRFREDRIANPETKETEVFESDIDLDDYDWFDMVEACSPFGYDAKTVDKWLTMGEEFALIAECIFEGEN